MTQQTSGQNGFKPRSQTRRRAWRSILLAGCVALLTCVIWWRISLAYENILIDQKRTILQSRADGISAYLTSVINRRQALLNGLAATVRTNTVEELRNGVFDSFAAGLQANDQTIRVIQFYPAEGNNLVYPVKGNEAVLNYTLDSLRNIDRPIVRADVERTLETREITLSKPYELLQGGKGVVARLAIYENNDLLGLAVIVLNLDPLLEVPGLYPAPEDVKYALKDSEGQVFYGDETVFAASPVVTSIILPEGNWTLGATPLPNWRAGLETQLVLFWVIGIVLAALIGGMTFLILDNQSMLLRTVQERTAALTESEARYATALKMVNEGIWDWHTANGIEFASENFNTLLGYADTTIKTLYDWAAHTHPAQRGHVVEEIRESIETGKGFDIEMQMRRTDGQWIDVLLRGRAVEWDRSGKAVRLVGTVSDITDRKMSETQLRESEAKFRSLFENNHAAMLLISPDTGVVHDANPAACEYYGWDHATFLTKSIHEINTMSKEEIQSEMNQAVKEQRNYFQFKHRLANGTIRDVEVFSGPIEHNGKVLLYSIVHDITSLKHAEKVLRDSENRLRFALEGANDGMWDIQMKTNEVFLSPRGCEILGYGPLETEQAKVSWMDLVHPDDKPEADRKLKNHIEGRTQIFEVEQRLRMKSGEWKWVLTRGKLVERGEDGTPLRMTGTHTDITLRKETEAEVLAAQKELKRLLADADESRKVLLSVVEDQKIAEEKLSVLNAELEHRVQERTAHLEAANRELEAFSYSVSHDLRAPLRGIDGWSLALLEDYREQLDENGRHYIDRVRSETQRMGMLIDDLLRLSRVTRVEMKVGSVNLSEMAITIATRLHEEHPERRVEFRIEPGLVVTGDQNLLEIVLTNLLSNAYKFTGKESESIIEFGKTCTTEGNVQYFVRDNGVGFDMSYAKNLFGAFQRMHRQSDFPGTGIGLATVQRIVFRHGGKVWADAKKNEGATFYFTLGEN